MCYNAPVGVADTTRNGLFDNVEMKMLTMKQLQKFVKVRAKSGFASNLQFQFDASECGFEVSDLGDLRVFHIDGSKGYEWKPDTKQGKAWLVEFFGRCYLNDNDDEQTRSTFNLMKRAVYQEKAA